MVRSAQREHRGQWRNGDGGRKLHQGEGKLQEMTRNGPDIELPRTYLHHALTFFEVWIYFGTADLLVFPGWIEKADTEGYLGQYL